jgi:hypothetical protein
MLWTRRCASVAGLVCLAVTLPALFADARTLSESPRADVLDAARAEALRDAGENDRLSGAASPTISSPTDAIPAAKAKKRPKKKCRKGYKLVKVKVKRKRRGKIVTVKVKKCRKVKKAKPPPPRPPLPQGDFTGDLVTTVRYRSVCGGQPLGEQTTRIPSRVTVRPPLRPNPNDLQAPGQENNPINLILGQTSVGGTIAPGSINLASAARFRFTSINSLILPYWNLTLNGAALAGTLAQDHREEAAAFNLLAAHVELAPCFPQFGTFVNQLAIAEGATLTGTITPQTIQLRITGNTIDTFHPFTAEITATRTG